ncbi:Transcription factor GRAS domain-containing protein [Dioscorea alata]|uniref:Transcription factor GRAS domain-containing protein n=1 Tax=Dioscorea alata TaxID=55571 RepID=A0ACB7VTG7_DIOAL|nr:Transcription factor GRAS domain-containing protein [Dioscorea alata]
MDFYEDFSLEDMIVLPSYNDHQYLWIDEEEASSSLQDFSEVSSNDQQHHHHHHHQQQQQQQVFVSNILENYQELSIFHLLKAYGEAKENKHIELGDVIEKRLCSQVSPMGTTMERLGHHLLHSDDLYLREESSKNYGMALRAFYEICPYGRFAHLATNFAILESLPCDVQVIHIIDFDVGEGEQWPALLAALNRRISVKLSVIHCKEVEKTRNNLCSFACSIGLNLQIEEMEMEELLLMFDRTVNENEWFVFNCMVGLPHMGEPKRRRQVLEFTRVAEKVVTSHKGIGMISYGEGFGIKVEAIL